VEVCSLVNNKYTTWNWNFGHTPQFTYTNKLGEKIKVSDIAVSGNEDFSDKKIRRFMKNTKKKNFFRFYKRSKLIPSDFEEDKQRIVDKLKERGYRDARVVSDSVIKDSESTVKIELEIKEGKQYYFGENFNFLGK